MKNIDTLVDDIYEVVKGKGGWNSAITEYFLEHTKNVVQERLEKPQEQRDYLSLSMLGTPCKRKIWYTVNKPELADEINSLALGTFLYGDLLEGLILSLAKAAGHDVKGEQDTLEVEGVKGHRDAIIDGMTVDIKTTSKSGMNKFLRGNLREDDPFGYISQLSSYIYADQSNPDMKEKTRGAFLVVQKDQFRLHLDIYDLKEELLKKRAEVIDIKEMVAGEKPKERLESVPLRAGSKNMKICLSCKYCPWKRDCWPEARVFEFSTGYEWLTHIEREPKVEEISKDEAVKY